MSVTGETAPPSKDDRLRRWERRAEIPLLLLAVAFLVAYAWPVINPNIDEDLRSFLEIVSWTVWVAFALDFGARLVLASHRLAYARSHWYDVALIVLPFLRPLRLLRLLALARLLQRSAASSLIGRVSIYVVGAALMALCLGAIAVLDAEQEAEGANITTFGDALWWSATTVTSVGYGDRFPVTGQGRFIAVGLMLVGIALVGAITASIATWMVGQFEQQRDSGRPADRQTGRPADRLTSRPADQARPGRAGGT